MKRIDLLRQLGEMGCVLLRNGGKHDWYHNPLTKMSQAVPRHRELKEYTARSIIKKLSNDYNG